MSLISYQNIVPFLLENFPEFKESDAFGAFDEDDLKLAYVIWGAFAAFAVQRFKEQGANDPVLQKIFRFINEQFSDPNSDPEVRNLLVVEIFETFAQNKETLSFARECTTDKNARHSLEMSLVFTGVDKPDLTIAPEAKKILG